MIEIQWLVSRDSLSWNVSGDHVHDKMPRVARTLADLECMDDIAEHHVAEAIQYRNLDRQAL